MEYKELTSQKRKPPFYESHQKIIDSTLMEPPQLALYLHENMLSHFHDIGDVADAVDTYSTLEGPMDRLDFEQIGYTVKHDLGYQLALAEAIGITEFNEHSKTQGRGMI